MAPSTSGRRRLSLDLIQRAVTDISLEVQGVSKYMDLRLPHHASTLNVVSKVECECCGLFEDCTGAYVRRVRDRFCGRWVCGLCSEAVKEEVVRHVTREEALSAHMEVCRRFNRTVRANPALSLASAMTEILKKSSRRGREACKVNRSYSAV